MADQESQAKTNDPVTDALEDAQQAVDQMQGDLDAAGGEDAGLDLPDFAEAGRIDMLGDVDLDVSIELGRTEMLVEDVLKLGPGAVVELDKLAGDPVDIHVNGRLVARGEVLVLNDNFCIRVSEIVANLEEQAAAIEAEAEAEARAAEPQ